VVRPRSGGGDVVSNLLRSAEVDGEVVRSTEDLLAAYADMAFPGRPEPPTFAAHPVLVRVTPGREWDAVRRLHARPEVEAAIPNFLTRPAAPAPRAVQIDAAALDVAVVSVLGSAVPPYGCGQGVRVAVLDTGIDPAVAGREAIEPVQLDADRPRADGGAAPVDPVGHGSLVAHIVHRIAPEARLTAVKVLEDHGDAMALAAGFFLAHAYVRPHVYNLSLALAHGAAARCPQCGYGAHLPHTGWHVARVLGAFRTALAPGDPAPIFVAAAGNWTAMIPEPAAVAPAIAVGAIDRTTHQTPRYSRYGRVPHERFVRAPGGDNTDIACFAHVASRAFGTERLFGTSFAAPFVSGLAARYLCYECGLGARGGPPPEHTEADVVLACLAAGSDTDFAGYSAVTHGLGFARWDATVLDRVLQQMT
jgi:hypothetical protein